MTFAEVLAQVRELLQSKGRVSYRALKLQFNLDDDYLAGLKDELIEAEQVAADEGGKVLVWVGGGGGQEPGNRRNGESETSDTKVASGQLSVASPPQPLAPSTQHPDIRPQTRDARQEAAERRQLTVMFCDLVGSTTLSEQLDPEELRQVIRVYQQAGAEVISRYEGHIAQYLGDGLLVYFGYPFAHEDDAQRAVRAGLEIIQALQTWVPSPPAGEACPEPSRRGQGEGAKDRVLQVRIGIHTGPVVVGEIGSGERREQLALGETPNVAARVQGIAAPNTVVISAATQRLVAGFFECQDLGPQRLKNVSTPLTLYQVVQASEVQSRFEVAVRTGLTPLVGREYEVGLLRERWEKAKAGNGQVVLLSGEPGIGKSRLVQVLKDHVEQEGATRIEFRCSPYHQNSAFYPIIDHLQRLLQFHREETPQAKLVKLQRTLATYRFLQADTLPLLAALLSLPHPEGTPPITLSPQKQKQKTQEALVAWMIEEAERQTAYSAWEDLHWADPSTLEVLSPLLDQVSTARLLVLLTFRPEFTPPWGACSYLSHLALSRLAPTQIEEMVENVTGGKALPPEAVQQIVAKTDGVPLFVEELTKVVVESVESVGSIESTGSVESIGSEGRLGRSAIPLGIPATLQDALMARLDRLGTAKEIAQVGAVLGREFSYELLHTVFPLEEGTLQQGLRQLIDAELIYQHGLPPQATYLFKHALIQDTAYQSLLKSTRQQYHQQIAQVLEERFPETKETQPELLAHHCTEAGLIAQAIPYWQKAGQRAWAHSGHAEAISHFTRALELLDMLPETLEKLQLQLTLYLDLGKPLIASKGEAAEAVEHLYSRARELCERVGEIPQYFSVLYGLWGVHHLRGELRAALDFSQQLVGLAEQLQDPALTRDASSALESNLSACKNKLQDPALTRDASRARGDTLFYMGEISRACGYLEQAVALDESVRQNTRSIETPRIACHGLLAILLSLQGHLDQGLARSHESVTLAEASQPFDLAFALSWAAVLHAFRREESAVRERAEAAVALATEQGFPLWIVLGRFLSAWAATFERPEAKQIATLEQTLGGFGAMGVQVGTTLVLALLAEVYGKASKLSEGLEAVNEGLKFMQLTDERLFEAELHRLKGELTLQQSKVQSLKSKVPSTQHPAPSTQAEVDAEACFQKAIEIARKQQAKSLELRATVSLARLWQQQGRRGEARQMLNEIYTWFTEGFDTKDLKEAKKLLEELAR